MARIQQIMKATAIVHRELADSESSTPSGHPARTRYKVITESQISSIPPSSQGNSDGLRSHSVPTAESYVLHENANVFDHGPRHQESAQEQTLRDQFLGRVLRRKPTFGSRL
jgi:hypothetical protein